MNSNKKDDSNEADPKKGFFGPVISTYSRYMALADGVLIDVTLTAREVGFFWPVAVTRAAWNDCVAWDDRDSDRQTPQDEGGRLWDVLWMAMFAIYSNRRLEKSMEYSLSRVPRDGKSARSEETRLKMVCGLTDKGQPVVTIMLPTEG